MNPHQLLVQREGESFPSGVLRIVDDWGLQSVDLLSPPTRFWPESQSPRSLLETGIDVRRVVSVPTPGELLAGEPDSDTWGGLGRRTIARLFAWFLICEDPQRRLEARAVNTLSHQVSLVRHVLDAPNLQRVLIADEVGLGKTIEAGLIVQELLAQQSGLRILYLAPARLVSNVREEFERMGLHFRQWSATDSDARWNDPRIIASIHRAVHANHFHLVVNSAPWDVLIVDECHHLSDWAAGGGDPRDRFRLVRDLIARQPRSGRVIFLSGTPHQGHPSRFENLLGLLRRSDEPIERLQGRVIYRTKEDVRDWDDRPLFPRRQVNQPFVIDLGPDYRQWLEHIHDWFSEGEAELSDTRRRAVGWRAAQAMQWATSSPQAGLGYLIRHTIRQGGTLASPALAHAIAAIRPYRNGPADEPVDHLFHRLRTEVTRSDEVSDIEDAEDSIDDAGSVDRQLEDLLMEGIDVLTTAGNAKWDEVYQRLLLPAGEEKVVLFAQPIETVVSIANYLERCTGRRPAIIIGGQSDQERRAEVASFRRADGPTYLVSSKAGGEGINLQISRRLIHLDVPWNPMDMEQRVGRVHRFGSRHTILVDTVVVRDSREAEAYQVARERLRYIAETLVEPERFEAVFSRVMCLISPQELGDIIVRDLRLPFNDADQAQLSELVQNGFHTWQQFDRDFGERQHQIRSQPPGLATWELLAEFLRTHAGAEPMEGFTAARFHWSEGEITFSPEFASVLGLDQKPFACGDYAGTVVTGPNEASADQLGLNIPTVATALRKHAFPTQSVGAAHIRWNAEQSLPIDGLTFPFGVLIFVRQSIQMRGTGGHEMAPRMECYIVREHDSPVLMEGERKSRLIRGLIRGSFRNKAEPAAELVRILRESEIALARELRRPSDADHQNGIRHGVTPLVAAVISA